MRKLMSALIVPLVFLALTASPVEAGGWAVTSLDELPELTVGRRAEIGLTVRQHGVTPVDIDGVAIKVTNPSGEVETFAALRRGAVGHYVARVTFREAGRHRWVVQQGERQSQALGAIDITAGSATTIRASNDGFRWAAPLRVALTTLATSFVVVGIVDIDLTYRRRRLPGALS